MFINITLLYLTFLKKCYTAQSSFSLKNWHLKSEELENNFLKYMEQKSKEKNDNYFLNDFYMSIINRFKLYDMSKYLTNEIFYKINFDLSYDGDFPYKCFEKLFFNKIDEKLDPFFKDKLMAYINDFSHREDSEFREMIVKTWIICGGIDRKPELCFLPIDFAIDQFINFSKAFFGDVVTSEIPLDQYELNENNFVFISLLRFIIKNLKELQEIMVFKGGPYPKFNDKIFFSAYKNFMEGCKILFATIGTKKFLFFFSQPIIIKYYNSFLFINQQIKFFNLVLKNKSYEKALEKLKLCSIMRIISLTKYGILMEDDAIESIEKEIEHQKNASLISKFYNNILGVFSPSLTIKYKSNAMASINPISENFMSEISKDLVENVIKTKEIQVNDLGPANIQNINEDSNKKKKDEEIKYLRIFKYDEDGNPFISDHDASSYNFEEDNEFEKKDFLQDDFECVKDMVDKMNKGDKITTSEAQKIRKQKTA